MKQLIKIKFGSHLYGTNTANSDTDYKGVYIPEMDDLLLGKQPQTSITTSTGKQLTKNTNEDVDVEMFTLHGYLKMVAKGEVVALDMLFAPEESWVDGEHLENCVSTEQWQRIASFAKQNLLSKQTTAYIGYCRKQAAKYGIKGSRVSEVRDLLTLLESFPDKKAKLHVYIDEINKHCETKSFTEVITSENASTNIGGGGVKNPYANMLIDCCNKKCSLTNSVQNGINMYKILFNAYGERALQAESNENVDWKAMHHAIRACEEAIELLTDHKITFPLTRAEYHRKIKQGLIEYKVVAEELEKLMEQVELAAKSSTLPEKCNIEEMEKFVCKIYREYA